jgi:putative ribosome biogenesis GTPase RsgA
MALRTTIIYDVNFVGPTELDVYARISVINCTKTHTTAVVSWHHVDGDGLVIKSYGFRFETNHDGPAVFSQAYLHLKTLPEFATATDC